MSLTISGLIKVSENSFLVKDDKSCMSLLEENANNEKNLIQLFVSIEEVLTQKVSLPRVVRCGPS